MPAPGGVCGEGGGLGSLLRRGWSEAGRGLREADGQRGGSEDSPPAGTPGRGPTSCSPALQLQPSILGTNYSTLAGGLG